MAAEKFAVEITKIVERILGRTPVENIIDENQNTIVNSGEIISEKHLESISKLGLRSLKIRSVLTCETEDGICSICYGRDLARGTPVNIGEAVGIIAAQSIGEPGTQLTMRTFHTGGIFTGETLKQVVAPFSGKLILPDVLKTVLYRTNHGTTVLKLMQETTVTVINWQGKKEEIFLDIGSYLYVKNSSFIRKNQLISEYSTQTIIPGQRKLKPISSSSLFSALGLSSNHFVVLSSDMALIDDFGFVEKCVVFIYIVSLPRDSLVNKKIKIKNFINKLIICHRY